MSPFIVVICMISFSMLLRKIEAAYEWGGKEFKLDHLPFMDDIKVFGKGSDQIV